MTDERLAIAVRAVCNRHNPQPGRCVYPCDDSHHPNTMCARHIAIVETAGPILVASSRVDWECAIRGLAAALAQEPSDAR